MPRGSKPGERRGGRRRGTPNKRTVLVERILAAASANPTAPLDELLAILTEDQALPAGARIAIARKASLIGASRSNNGRMGKSVGLAERPRGFLRRSNGQASDTAPAPSKTSAVRAKADRAASATIVFLLSVVQDTHAGPEDRRKAASQVAQFFLPKNPRGPRRRKFPADECGFSVDPQLARELRDTKLKIVSLPLETKKRTPYALAQKVSALQARIKEIQQSLQCPCPNKYGLKHFERDIERLAVLRQARAEGTVFSVELDLEEAIRMARYDSFLKGPEIAARRRLKELKLKKRIADQRRTRLNPVELTNFRFLSLLFPPPPSTSIEEMPEEHREAILEDHPFVSPRYFEGNPNYPDGYLIFGTPKRRKIDVTKAPCR
jgi:hypothetical protein